MMDKMKYIYYEDINILDINNLRIILSSFVTNQFNRPFNKCRELEVDLLIEMGGYEYRIVNSIYITNNDPTELIEKTIECIKTNKDEIQLLIEDIDALIIRYCVNPSF